MYDEQEIEIDKAQAQWMINERFTADPKTNALIRERVERLLESGGYVSTSHFSRAYVELINEDEIQPFRGSLAEQPAAAPATSPDVISFIESPRTSASELRRRYNSNPTFRQQYDAYEK